MVICNDSLEFLEKQKDYENDIIFADPPYALGSEITIRQDGRVDYAKASDFMNKWQMPTGEYWERWFAEAYRTLKHGGFLIMYGMDRQLLMFKYYAAMAGFQEQQSIYWYYISNFPKAVDLSKMIDKNAGVEREQLEPSPNARPNSLKDENLYKAGTVGKEFNLTAPSTDLAKKYEGYKYSVSPLKQTCETVMVFKKPNKSGSVLHDTLAMENGDDTIVCSALNIDGNRVGTEKFVQEESGYEKSKGVYSDVKRNAKQYEGRYPAQTFIDSQVAEKLDLQSGLNVGQKGATTGKEPSTNKQGRLYNDYSGYGKPSEPRNDVGGCSKILHKCDYEQIDFDLFIYEPKVNSGERNNGLDDMSPKERVFNGTSATPSKEIKDVERRFTTMPSANNHPTLKPIDLNCKILKLFKTPNDQRICYPFAGSGSEIIGGLKADFQNWTACEINQEYVDIANARITHYKENEYVQLELF